MAKTIKARVFFGERISRAVDENDRRKARELYEAGDGAYCERTFGTTEEREAYFQGLADMYGWDNCFALADHMATPSWAKHNLGEP